MRPSSINCSNVRRATSRRIGSNPDSITAPGVSSIIRSTPVACSRARIFLPSRPIMRPLIESSERATTEIVLSATLSDANLCTAMVIIFLASSSALFCASSSIFFTSFAASRRAKSTTFALISSIACSAVKELMLSSFFISS